MDRVGSGLICPFCIRLAIADFGIEQIIDARQPRQTFNGRGDGDILEYDGHFHGGRRCVGAVRGRRIRRPASAVGLLATMSDAALLVDKAEAMSLLPAGVRGRIGYAGIRGHDGGRGISGGGRGSHVAGGCATGIVAGGHVGHGFACCHRDGVRGVGLAQSQLLQDKSRKHGGDSILVFFIVWLLFAPWSGVF